MSVNRGDTINTYMQGEAKEEVRAKLDIEAVIGEYVQLRRAGRNWKGLSPFSDEKTPSFFVSPEKGIWHDFSSNQGGDLFSFVMQVEGLDFRGALEHLARKAGVDLSLYEHNSGAGKGLAEKKKRLLAMHESATTFYQRSLFADKTASDYVKKRGFNRQVVHDFRLGYAPADGRSLLNFLTSKGFTTKELRDGGLIGTRGTDLFRERLMVPLMDGQGQVIGFTARLIRDLKGAPKYLNTPQTLLYDKGRHVFGLHLAKEAIRKESQAVIVEGNLDVISSHQADVKQVVATAGTALTEYHLRALSRLTERIALSFDGDKAGLAATERAIPIAQHVGVELSVISLQDGAKDPDELIQKDIALWKKSLKSALPAVQWLIGHYQTKYDVNKDYDKEQLVNRVARLLRQVDSVVMQRHYAQLLGEATNLPPETLERAIELLDVDVPQSSLKTPKHRTSSENQLDQPKQDHLLALLVMDHELRDTAMELSVDAFDGETRQTLFRHIVTHPGTVTAESIPPELQPFETYVKIVQLKAETIYSGLSAPERLNQAEHLVGQIKQQHLKTKKTDLTNQLREAEAAGDETKILRLRSELNDLIKEEYSSGKSRE